MIHNGNKGRFEYALGAFNGHGDKGVLNVSKGKFSNPDGRARLLSGGSATTTAPPTVTMRSTSKGLGCDSQRR